MFIFSEFNFDYIVAFVTMHTVGPKNSWPKPALYQGPGPDLRRPIVKDGFNAGIR